MSTLAWIHLLKNLTKVDQQLLIISAHWQLVAAQVKNPEDLAELWTIYESHLPTRNGHDAERSPLYQSRPDQLPREQNFSSETGQIPKDNDEVAKILAEKYGTSDILSDIDSENE